ncbi:MAG: hypothetical protein KGQ28_11430, partial [Hyphomicrobiales bacterium]|nr:hypothetical protein [Hyphomicrobiales bacterium]
MLLRDMLNSCTHPAVAAAALGSLGGRIAARACVDARRRGLRVGDHVASLVRRFRRAAGPEETAALERAMRGSDLPLLAGLAFVLDHEFALDDESEGLDPADIAAASRIS